MINYEKTISSVTRPSQFHLITVVRYICLLAGTFLLSCTGCDKNTISPELPGRSAIVYQPNGSVPASNATIKLFIEGTDSDCPVAVYFTDRNGRFVLDKIPDGMYTVWLTLDTLVARQDSVLVTAGLATLQNDTLEYPSTLSGTVAIKPEHDSRTVKVKVLGSDLSINVTDISGPFTLSGLAKGNYMLLMTCSFEDYLPTYFHITITGNSKDTIRDTLRSDALGMPVVSGIHISEDTLVGKITVRWNKTLHKDVLDYLIYRKSCDAKDFTFIPLCATNDTIFVDSLYVSLPASLTDTLERCLRYWIALRSNSTKPGPAYHYNAWQFAPKSFIMIDISHKIYNKELLSDSASVNDPLKICVTAKNRTRPIRSLTLHDPANRFEIFKLINPDPLSTMLSDTLTYSFETLGRNTIWAIAEDNAGVKDTQNITVSIVPDIPVAYAGPDTGVFTGEKALLHGIAKQSFGTITTWKWKIGNGKWSKTSGPDTVVIAPDTEETVICSLSVTDEDGNTSLDAMTFYTARKIIAIASGAFHNLMIKSDGTAWSCYNDGVSVTGDDRMIGQVLSDVKSIAAGGNHSLFLKSDNSLWTCGSNEYGQLGDGTTKDRSQPLKMMDGVKGMAAGRFHSLVVKQDNSLWTFGANDSGQLGDSTTIARYLPVQVMNGVDRVAAGWFHTLILGIDGTLWSCGDNNSGKLGDETIIDKNVPIKIMDNVLDIAASERHTLVLRRDGTLWTCGNNWVGQLGDSTGGRWVKPQQVFSGVWRIAAGRDFTLILKTDGSLWGCGANQFGQLGDGSNDDRYKPVLIADDVQSMSAGDYHSMLLKKDGSLWITGDDYYGQLCCTSFSTTNKPLRLIPYISRGEDE